MKARPPRIERDTLGAVRVPAGALWGPQTQRAVENFRISGQRMPRPFLRALGLVKASCARVNRDMGLLPARLASAVERAALEVSQGRFDAHFPVDVYQTGSGTSTNMNANEVIARLASRALGRKVHPNDHVNRGQSSNDVIPTAIHVSAALEVTESLLPALDHLRRTILRKARSVEGVVKTGRTHLMDAMPIRLSQEMSGWAEQVANSERRVASALPRLCELALGGTAVGTGVNTPRSFGPRVAADLRRRTGVAFSAAPNYFEKLAAVDAAVELSGQMRGAAVSVTKIANDLRWMNSGPLSGLGEIRLPALQPGSSIMPGKVNPVIPEAVLMACARVMGDDLAVALAGQSGSFELNTMLPLTAHCLLESVALLSSSARALADKAVADFAVDAARMASLLERNPVLATALSPVIGYEAAARVARRAAASGTTVRQAALEAGGLAPERLARLLDPEALTEGGSRSQ
ncbi:MAG: class II fumarate hydratase [Elusimicrobia bacterium]|nr:class II fumarate hydratase [Elusimicrobiota bacterium]